MLYVPAVAAVCIFEEVSEDAAEDIETSAQRRVFFAAEHLPWFAELSVGAAVVSVLVAFLERVAPVLALAAFLATAEQAAAVAADTDTPASDSGHFALLLVG